MNTKDDKSGSDSFTIHDLIDHDYETDESVTKNTALESENSSFVAVVPVIEVTSDNGGPIKLTKSSNHSSNLNSMNKKAKSSTAASTKKSSKKKEKSTVKQNNSTNPNTLIINQSVGYSIRDINSTTNLLGLDETSSLSDGYVNVPASPLNNPKYSLGNNRNGSNTLLINTGFNSNSQSSMDSNGRYLKDPDSIPLVRLPRKLFQCIVFECRVKLS
jgi:hypothetical protein